MNYVEFEILKGCVLDSIEGLEEGSDLVIFKTSDGREFRMYHVQDCCETVSINDVVGDVSDLIGYPITFAEVSVSADPPEGVDPSYAESQTWTFYKLATIKGYVDIRWWGTSNGYYSEAVSFAEVE